MHYNSSTLPKMMAIPPRSIAPLLRSGRMFARNVSSKPYTAEGSPASKSASTGPQATTPPTGFAAIASYDVIARRWLGIMVGTPVVVVTSYILYQRVINGEEPRPFDQLLKGNDSMTDRSEDG